MADAKTADSNKYTISPISLSINEQVAPATPSVTSTNPPAVPNSFGPPIFSLQNIAGQSPLAVVDRQIHSNPPTIHTSTFPPSYLGRPSFRSHRHATDGGGDYERTANNANNLDNTNMSLGTPQDINENGLEGQQHTNMVLRQPGPRIPPARQITPHPLIATSMH